MKQLLSFLLAIGSSLFSAFVMMKAFDWLIEPEFGFGLTYYQAVIIQFVWSFFRMKPQSKSDWVLADSWDEEKKEKYFLFSGMMVISYDALFLLIFWIISLF